LVLAQRFEKISNIKHYRKEHPREIGERLKYLVQQGMLVSSGHGRGMRYCLQGKKMPDLFSEMDVNSEHYQEKSEHKEINSEHNDSSSEHYAHLLNLAEPIRISSEHHQSR